jgi:hypothetical protein
VRIAVDRPSRLKTGQAATLPGTAFTPTLPGAALSSGGGSMTLQDLRDRQRQDKLEDIRRQVAEGRLVMRQMTAEERERYPPPSARCKNSRPQASRPPR